MYLNINELLKQDIFQKTYLYNINLFGKVIINDNSFYLLKAHDEKYILEINNDVSTIGEYMFTLNKVDDFMKNILLDEASTFLIPKISDFNLSRIGYWTIFGKHLMIADDGVHVKERDLDDHKYYRAVDYIDFITHLTMNKDNLYLDDAKDYVNTFIKNTNAATLIMSSILVRPKFLLKDGISLSIQASSAHYSSLDSFEQDKYETVEVGFPSEPIPELLPYAEDSGAPTDSVYAYVPVDLLNNIIEAHGIDEEFKNKYIDVEDIER